MLWAHVLLLQKSKEEEKKKKKKKHKNDVEEEPVEPHSENPVQSEETGEVAVPPTSTSAEVWLFTAVQGSSAPWGGGKKKKPSLFRV